MCTVDSKTMHLPIIFSQQFEYVALLLSSFFVCLPPYLPPSKEIHTCEISSRSCPSILWANKKNTGKFICVLTLAVRLARVVGPKRDQMIYRHTHGCVSTVSTPLFVRFIPFVFYYFVNYHIGPSWTRRSCTVADAIPAYLREREREKEREGERGEVRSGDVNFHLGIVRLFPMLPARWMDSKSKSNTMKDKAGGSSRNGHGSNAKKKQQNTKTFAGQRNHSIQNKSRFRTYKVSLIQIKELFC